MYTLLLVGDEEEVTRIIAKKVKWNDLGFSVIGHANNGLKALEMLEEMQPDVVMTDIRMPYMDGLELCGQIREKYPATKLVLFTGFDEYNKQGPVLTLLPFEVVPSGLFCNAFSYLIVGPIPNSKRPLVCPKISNCLGLYLSRNEIGTPITPS